MSAPQAVVEIKNPYPGLRPFEVEEFESFFGRDRQIDELLTRLRDHRFVAVVGLSGSGKSSVVRAGLIHRLQVGHLTSAGAGWKVALFRPGSEPIDALAAALDEALGKQHDRTAELRKSTQGLLNSTRTGRSPSENLLLVVDQFEEIFRFQRDKQLSERDAAHFVNLLLAAEQDLSPDYRVYLVLTMRTDYLGDCAQFEGLPEALNRSQYLVPRLTREQTREAIEGPAAMTDTEIASDLMQTLLVESAEGRDTLPLLQHALTRLWEKRQTVAGGGWKITAEHYRTLGGMAKALNDHADDVLADLRPVDGQDLAKKIFQELTEVGQGRDQRRPQRLSLLVRRTGATLPEVTAVVQHFLDASFLTSPDSGHAKDWEVDISHESLIRQWGRLKNWATEEAQDRDDYLYFAKRVDRGGEPLTGADLALALKWRERKHGPEWAERYGGDFARTVAMIERSREEERKRREGIEEQRRRELQRARRLQRIFAAVAAVFLLLLVLAWVFYRRAERARVEADAATARVVMSQQAAEAAKNEALKAKGEADVAKNEALNSLDEANKQKGIAESARQATERQLRIALSNQLAAQAVHFLNEQRDLSLLLSIEAYQSADTPEARRSLMFAVDSNHYLITFLSSQDRRFHSKQIASMAFSPDGKLLASGSDNGEITIWDAQTRKPWEPSRIQYPAQFLFDLAFSPNGQLLLSCGSAGVVSWDVHTFHVRNSNWPVKSLCTSIAFSADGKLLAIGTKGGVTFLDVLSRQEVGQPLSLAQGSKRHDIFITSVFSPDGRILATSIDKSIMLWDVATRSPVGAPLTGHDKQIISIAFNPRGTILASSGEDGKVLLWDLTSRQQLGNSLTESDVRRVRKVAFSPDGRLLAAASKNLLWDVAARKKLTDFTGYSGVTQVSFSPDGRTLATGTFDGTIMLWDPLGSQSLGQPLINGVKELQRVALSANGVRVAAIKDGKAIIWNMADLLKPSQLFIENNSEIKDVALSADGSMLAAATANQVILFDIGGSNKAQGTTAIRDFPPGLHEYGRHVITFSTIAKRLAINGVNGSILLWDAGDMKAVSLPFSMPGSAVSITLSPDNNLVAIGGYSYIWLWDVSHHEINKTLTTGRYSVVSMRFSPDGKTLAAGSDGGVLQWWDVASGKRVGLDVETSRPVSLAFSRDGKNLASGSDEGSIVLWDVSSHQQVSPPLLGQEGEISDLVFTPNGSTLVSGSQDGSLFSWNLDIRSLLTRACRIAARNLSLQEWRQFLGSRPYRKTCADVAIHPSFIAAGEDLARAGDIAGAEAVFRRGAEMEPGLNINLKAVRQLAAIGKGDELLKLGVQLLKLGNRTEGIVALKKALTAYTGASAPYPTATVSIESWNDICWLGALWGNARDFLTACEQAVASAPENGAVHDSRGVARARAGNFDGAIEDFQLFIDQTDNEEKRSQRQRWVTALRARKDPLTPEEIEKLRKW